MTIAQPLLAIALGATLGAWLRWGLSLWLNPLHYKMPMGTLAANLIGAYLIGVAIAVISRNPAISPQLSLFITTGFLGGLTTFSAFSVETVDLLTRQHYFWGMTIIMSHVLGSLLMTFLGILTVKSLSA